MSKPNNNRLRNINPETASEQAKMRIALAQMRAAAERKLEYAKEASSDILGLGQAAARGGLFMDTSAAPGFQNPYTGAVTKMQQEMITEPARGAVGVYKRQTKRMNLPYWRNISSQYKTPQAGSGMYGDTTTAPAQGVVPQRIR